MTASSRGVRSLFDLECCGPVWRLRKVSRELSQAPSNSAAMGFCPKPLALKFAVAVAVSIGDCVAAEWSCG